LSQFQNLFEKHSSLNLFLINSTPKVLPFRGQQTFWTAKPFQPFEKTHYAVYGLEGCEERVATYNSTDNPTTSRDSLDVAGEGVGLPNKGPDILRLSSQSKGEIKALTILSVTNSTVAPQV